MQIEVTGRHLELTAAIEEYARKKAEKVSRFFDRILRVNVIIDKEHNAFGTEIIVDVEHHDPFVAHASSNDLYASIDKTVDRATRQLHDHKSRLRDSKHQTPTSGIRKTQ